MVLFARIAASSTMLTPQAAGSLPLCGNRLPSGFHRDHEYGHGAVHIALHKWLQAFHLMCSSKKGISPINCIGLLDIGYKAAWFMCHRIREAMRLAALDHWAAKARSSKQTKPITARREGQTRTKTKRRAFTKSGKKAPEQPSYRRAGRARRQCPHIPCSRCRSGYSADDLRQNIAMKSDLHTDESRLYFDAADTFAAHETVITHRANMRVGDVSDPTNSAEGYFSIFKRGMRGVYQHCDEKHLHRYLAEFDFRYNHRVRAWL